MKIIGWIITTLGGIGVIGTSVIRDSSKYKLDGLASYIGLDQGYKTSVDIIFHLSIILMIIGAILLIIGYLRKPTKHGGDK